ncbi:MAG: Gldg family protein, partial [Phormidesmis sp.]
VEPLNLANTGAFPADADVLIIAGPQQALFDKEVAAVKDYLEADGSVFIMIDPQIKSGLEDLMSQWGVVPEDTLVIDTSGGGQLVGLGPAAPLVTDYGDHPITAAFEDGRSFFPVVRPLQIQAVSKIEETPLLFTNQRSHAQPITAGELSVDPDKAPEGPFAIGVALSRPASETAEDPKLPNKPSPEQGDGIEDTSSAEAPSETAQGTDKPELDLPAAESRMVVIGNSSFATDGLFGQQLNGDVFLNSVNWLSKSDNPTLSIRPKEPTNRRFNLTVTQQILLMLLALVVFPLLGLIGAGTLWARRR